MGRIDYVSDHAQDLVSKLLNKDLAKRLTNEGERVRDHPWFKDFDWAGLESGKLVAPWHIDENGKLDCLKLNADKSAASKYYSKIDFDMGSTCSESEKTKETGRDKRTCRVPGVTLDQDSWPWPAWTTSAKCKFTD